MSTHCGIAVKTEKGYETIYCHHDGYPEYMWEMLTENYNSFFKASGLVSLGDASSISKRMVPLRDSGHSFDNPEDDVCVFYHRDRGESWEDTAPEIYQFHEKSRLLNCYYYLYIFEEDCWKYYRGGKEIY